CGGCARAPRPPGCWRSTWSPGGRRRRCTRWTRPADRRQVESAHASVGVRNRAAHRPRHQADPRPVGRGRLGARPGRDRPGRQQPGGLPEAGEAGMSLVEQRLADLGLTLPEVAAPVAAYVPTLQHGDLVYVSGQLPWEDGRLPATGKVGEGEGLVDPQTAQRLAGLCALNAIAALKAHLGDLDRV